MTEKKYVTDSPLILSVLILTAIGIVMVYSASSERAITKFGDSNFFLTKHVIRVILGLLLMGIASQIDYTFYRKLSRVGLFIAIGLLLLVLISSNITVKGATRWLNIFGVSFQPAEVGKFAVIFYMADCLARKQDKLRSFTDGYLPLLITLGIVSFLILLEPDLSTAFILIAIVFMMFFIGNVRISHLAATVAAAIPLLVLAIMMAPYRLTRIKSFINPDGAPYGASYQLKQSLISLGSGGFLGAGIGMSNQKLLYLPEPFTDFIFAIVGEELGFIGAFGVLVLFMIILWRGVTIAKNAPDLYGSLLAMGITLAIVFAAFINIGVVCGLLPTTGLTMPFVSYGGTSLIVSLASMGVLLNIAGYQVDQKSKKTKRSRAKR